MDEIDYLEEILAILKSIRTAASLIALMLVLSFVASMCSYLGLV